MTVYDLKRDTLRYLPSHLKRMQEFREIMKAYDEELRKQWAELQRIEKNDYLLTMDEDGCEMWERVLRITRKDMDGLEDRRKRIIGYHASSLPYTEKKMNEVLTAMCGSGNYALVIDREMKTAAIKIMLNSIPLMNNAYEIIRRMIPCDLVLTADIVFNVHATFEAYTHEELGAYTHDDLNRNPIFQRRFNMQVDLGRRTHGDLAGMEHKQLMRDTMKEEAE